MKYLAILYLLFQTLFVFGQLQPKEKRKVDSTLVIARDQQQSNKERLDAYATLMITIYKDVGLGLEIIDEYTKLAKTAGESGHQAHAIDYLGRANINLGQLDKAQRYYNQMLDLAIDNDNTEKELRAYAGYGNVYEQKGYLDSSLYYHFKSFSIAEKTNRLNPAARAKLNIGTVYRKKGEYKESLNYLQEALDLILEREIKGYYTTIYNELGDVYLTIADYKKAKEYYKKALKYSKSENNKFKQVESYQKLGNLALKKDSVADAITHFQMAREIIEKESLNRGLAMILLGEAKIQRIQRKLDEALQTTEQAIKFKKESQMLLGIEEYYLQKGELLYALKNYQEAITTLKRGYDSAANKNNKKQLRLISYKLYQAYKQLEDLPNSFEYLEQFHKLEKANKKDVLVKEVFRMEIAKDFEKARVKDSLLAINRINELSFQYENEKEQQKIYFYWLLSSLIAFLIIFSIILHSFLRKKKYIKQLSEKNKTISESLKLKGVLVKEIHHRVKNNMQIASSLLSQRARNVDSKIAKEMLEESRMRLQSILLAHEKLYPTENIDNVELISFINDLALKLLPNTNNIIFSAKGEEVYLNIEQVQAIGLIIQELITNSRKYAWDSQASNRIIKVLVVQKYSDELYIKYTDNGIGLPQNFAISKVNSFGLKMVYSLVVRQLHGEIKAFSEKGAVFELNFKPR